MPRILHISEAYGGGVVTSINSFVQNSHDHEHHLLATQRTSEAISKESLLPFASVSALPRGLLRAVGTINETYSTLKPDYVHLHSSYAGVYGRLALIPTRKIIYSPHGFSFERLDYPIPHRLAFLFIEWLSGIRTGKFAGVSHYETRRARSFLGAAERMLLPNTGLQALSAHSPNRIGKINRQRKLTVVCVGRVAPQKDPKFLIDAIGYLDPEIREKIDFRWYGGGEPNHVDALLKAGVWVSGWSSHSDVLTALQTADLYVHTAAWEGFPMSVIEAAVCGSPVLLRQINAFEAIPLPKSALVGTPRQLAGALSTWALNERIDGDLYRCRDVILELCNPTSQAAALRRLYAASISAAAR